jgi:ABC-2 type transport system permease protein
VAVLLVAAGLGNGLGVAVTVGGATTVPRLTLAGLAYLPAMAVLAAVAAIAVAVRRPWIGWLAVAFIVLTLYLGPLLRLPQWVIDLSPVSRITAPTSYAVAPLIVMVAVAAVLTALAGLRYRRRDAV